MHTEILKHVTTRNETDKDVTVAHAITAFGQRVTALHDSEEKAWAEIQTPEGIARMAAVIAYVFTTDHKEKDHGGD